jgi:hypothetical protein
MRDEAVTKFHQNLRGTLIRRENADYDEFRKLYNAMIDKRPLMIARCADVADVIAAVNFARDNQLLIERTRPRLLTGYPAQAGAGGSHAATD